MSSGTHFEFTRLIFCMTGKKAATLAHEDPGFQPAWGFSLPPQLKTTTNLHLSECLEEDSALKKETGQLLKKENQVSLCKEAH